MAANGEGKLYFGIGLNNSSLRADANQATNILKGIGDKAVAEGARIDNAFRKAAAGLGSVFVFQQAQQFISQVARVRGEFQQLEVAFETMLKSKSKADALMSQMVKTAATTPFGLNDVANGAKQLLAYGESAETVNKTLIRLGDIASGLSIPFNDLVKLYGTTMVQGRLFTQDVRQFMGRGIPLIQELAKELGKTEVEINEMVTAGKIGFPEVQKVINNLTNEGGMFYNLMEKQSKTITGQISNLGDAWDTMLNKIGQSSEGIIGDVISGATKLVENYEAAGKTIIELVSVYGAYKAALIAVTVIDKQRIAFNKLVQEQILIEQALRKGATAAMVQEAATTKALEITKLRLVNSIKAVNAAMMKNPYVIVAASVAGLAYAIYKLVTAETAAEKAQKRLNEVAKEFEQSVASEQAQLDILFGRLKAAKEGTAAYEKAKKDIMSKADSYRSGLSAEIDLLNDISGAYKKISEAAIQAAKDRAIEKGTKDAADSYAESWEKNIKNIRNKFLEEFGNLKGEELFQGLSETLQDGGEFPKKIQDAISEFNKTNIQSDFNAKTTTAYVSNDVDVYIKNIRKSKEVLDNEIEKINSIYGTLFKPGSGGGDTDRFETFSEQVKAARENIKELKKELANLRNGKTESPDYAKDIEEKAKELNEAKEKLNYLLYGSKSATKKEKDYTEQIKRGNQEIENLYKDLEFAVEQARIDAMKEGAEKILAQNKLNYEKEVEQIKRQKEDLLKQLQDFEKTKWMAADPKRKEEDWSKSEEYKNVSLSDDDNKYFDNLLQSSKAKQDKFTQELINKYQDYATQRLDIEKKFNDDIALLQDQRIKAEKAGNKEMVEQINKAISKAVANKGKELISFDFDILKESPEYIRAFEDLKNTSTETLNSLLQQLEQAKSAASSTLDPSELREYTSTIQSIMDELSNRNPFEALVKAKEELALADEELAKAKADLDSTLNGTPVVKSIKIDSSTGKLVKEYLSLNEAIKKYNKALDKQKDKENEVVESRDKVLKSIGKLADAIEELGDSVGGEIGEIISLIGNISNVVLISVAAVNTVKKTAESTMSAVESASVILMVISAVIQIATKVASLLAGKHDKKKEAEIQSLQAKVDALKDSYDKLSKAIDKAYAADAADLIRQQNENLKQQKQILEEQIRLEEEKKKTDNDKVQGYKDAIKEIDETIEGSGERMIEAIIGKDISSAIDDFAEAYADAWAAGEDKAASMKEVVRKMIKSAVAELIKSRLAPEVTAFMTKLAEVMEDGIITVEEQMDLDYLESRIYNKLDGLDAGLDKYVKDKQEESREASSKGFESMSQDSADELNGRFTAMQALVSSITENTKILVANSGQMLQHLAGIESNTEACRRLDGMDSDLKAVKDSINHIALKGIIIKN